MKLIKRDEASELVLNMAVWGVLSVLVTRVYLKVMSNPTITFGQWHIAHVLFGGVFMMAGMLLILAFEGKKIRKSSAILFGIGWGLFIDEVGKYLTKKNDYWFRPAVIFIYISFVGLFLFYRYLERQRKKTAKEAFYSVLNNLEEIVEADLDQREKISLINKLNWIYNNSVEKNLKIVIRGIKEAVKNIKASKEEKGTGIKLMVEKIFRASYNRFFRRKMVMYGLWIYSVYYAVDKIIDILRISTSRQKMVMIQKFYMDYDFFGKSDVYMIVFKMFFDLIAAVLFLMGAGFFWSKRRKRGIRYFKYGLYVSVMLVSIFRFYFEQFGAIYEVIMGIILLELLNYYGQEAKKR